MDYSNFDLRLAGSAGAYTAEVLDAPAGQTSGPQAAVCGLPAIPDPATAAMPDLEASGRALWGCAFPGQVAELWRASLGAAVGDAGLRLRLTVEAPNPSAALTAQGGSSGPGWPRCRGNCFTIRLRNASWRLTRAHRSCATFGCHSSTAKRSGLTITGGRIWTFSHQSKPLSATCGKQ